MSALRGRIVWPRSPSEALFLADGVVDPALDAPRPARRGDPEPLPGVILPAFADWHFHWVQLGVAGAGSAPLLDWLRDTAWPAEARFADAALAGAAAGEAATRLARAGTLAGAAWGSPHAASAEAFLRAAPDDFLCGPAVMTRTTRGEPPGLVRPLPDFLEELAALHLAFGGRLAVTPRFAPSCDGETLAALGRFARERGLAVQTHLSETEEETAAALRLHPGAGDYLGIYERAGLVGPRTLLAHVVHPLDDELRRIAAARATVVHCPTSNAALRSGRMPLERLRRAGVRWVLGSDVGAGPRLSLLDVIAVALDAHAGRAPLTAVEAFHRASLGPRVVHGGGDPAGAARVADRPGAVAVREPPGVGTTERDPETWLRAIVDDARSRGAEVLRAIPWS